MTCVEKLLPEQPVNRAPCEAIVSGETAEWRNQQGHDLQCGHSAKYAIEGAKFCSLHAGKHALAVLMRESADDNAGAQVTALRAALEVMANQKLISEMHPDLVDGDYEGAYEGFIKVARVALSGTKEGE